MLLLVVSVSLLALTTGQTCGPKVSARLLREIPCDMGATSYCTQPGSAYPWAALKRYIFENQGTLKRMYGEFRQSNLIQEEIERFSARYELLDDDLFEVRRAKLLKVHFPDTFSTTPETVTENSTDPVTVPEATTNDETTATTLPATETEVKTEESLEDETEDVVEVLEESLTGREPSLEEPIDNTVTSERKPETEGPKGYPACPITQEVVAPYWANNTRGETLALLNVYPFEQYIHWEKCAYEEQQMFCREGCRCEQQYRLHRLLAFDPKNECRGIFADWFRFPGSCGCVCYDALPDRINSRKARL